MIQAKNIRTTIFFLLFFFLRISVSAQDDQSDNSDQPVKPRHKKEFKKWQAGLYSGAFFADNYSATVYDGFGFDASGTRNSFATSNMNQRINFEYGGMNGGYDLIAQALQVQPGQWTFAENNMPINMAYSISLGVGLQTRYNLDHRDALMLNVNASQLTIAGNFTIDLPNNSSANPQAPGFTNYKIFPIKGVEQRLIFQFGFHRLLGEKVDRLNFFYEGGPLFTLIKMVKNQIQINNLTIDLNSFSNSTLYPTYVTRAPVGYAMGLFGGGGLNIIGGYVTVQLVYDASLERLTFGLDPKFTFQQTAGFRAYW